MDTPAYDPLVGRLLDGRYLVGAKIARGGMATVYEATDLRLDRLVAVKVMPPALTDDDSFRHRFVREARAAARLTHPNVVGVYDQGDDHGILFLAMEHVAGRHTLRDVIRDEAPLEPRRALAIIEEILKAISAAHEAGIVHRDIKPENVLIDPRGQVKVADFGLARAISSATAATATGGVLMGTVSYLPPELVTDGRADARSDVYALGVLLFELLTGVKPHVGENPIQVAYKHVHDDVAAPSTVVKGIPPYLDALVARSTSRERDLRPADAHVMLQQVRRVRHALDHGVLDDEELTDDLSPTLAARTPHLEPSDAPAASASSASVGASAASVATSTSATSPDEVFDFAAYDDFTNDSTHDDTSDRQSDRGEPLTGAPGTRTPVAGERADDAETTMVVGVSPAGAAAGSTKVSAVPDRTAPGQAPPSKLDRASSRGRRAGWIALVIVLLLAAAAGYAGWWYGVGRFQPTPDVVSMSRPNAAAAVADAGLSFEVSDVAYSETIGKGKVISTDPDPGDKVLEDGTVSAVLSRGPDLQVMPDLDGLTESEAIDKINANSLTVGDTTRTFSDDVDEGTVISFSPKPGRELRIDSPVALVVSKGPKPVRIEDYVGSSADDVTSRLTAQGLEVKQRERYHDSVDAGVVISQRPDGGRLYPGDVLHLVVSLGPSLVEVPDVYTYGVEDATDALTDLGFEVTTEEAAAYFGLGFVVGQSVAGGESAPEGSTIVLTIV